jgi:hypothetical protein
MGIFDILILVYHVIIIFLFIMLYVKMYDILTALIEIRSKSDELKALNFLQYGSQQKLLDIKQTAIDRINHSSRDIRRIYSHLVCNSSQTRYYSKIKRHSFC